MPLTFPSRQQRWKIGSAISNPSNVNQGKEILRHLHKVRSFACFYLQLLERYSSVCGRRRPSLVTEIDSAHCEEDHVCGTAS